jgi:hypothetical protein
VEVVILPTVLVMRPLCIGRMMKVADQLGQVSVHTARFVRSAGQLGTHACRTAAKAEFLAKVPASMDIVSALSPTSDRFQNLK